jgi:hypothetical protein
VLVEGVHVLWGFGVTINNVTQTFISRQTLVGGATQSVKIAGTIASPETPPTLLDAVTSSQLKYLRSGTLASCGPVLSFAGSTTSATLACTAAPSIPLWTVSLVSEDVSGTLVATHVRNSAGAVAGGSNVNASTVFAAGSVAYVANFIAREELIVVNTGNFVAGTTNLVGRGWCQNTGSAGYLLGVMPLSNNTVALYEVAGTSCSLTGLTPVATGTWEAIAPTGSYRLTYPEAFRVDAKWSGLFAGASSSLRRAFDIVYFNNQSPSLGVVINAGEQVRGLQPQFNAAALPSLKTAAGFP